MKKIFLLSLLVFLLVGCREKLIEVNDFYYVGPYSSPCLYYNQTKVDLSDIEELIEENNWSEELRFISDYSTNNIYICAREEDYSSCFLYKVDKGVVDTATHYTINYAEDFYSRYVDNDETVIFEERKDSHHISGYLMNIITGEFIKKFEFDTEEFLLYPIAFAGNKIFYENGYYSFEQDAFCKYPLELQFVRNSPDGKRIIGLDEEGYITIFDFQTGFATRFNLKRKINKGCRYTGNDIYFIDENSLFVSKDIDRGIIDAFFCPWYTLRKWYKIDLNDMSKEQIRVPLNQVYILARKK